MALVEQRPTILVSTLLRAKKYIELSKQCKVICWQRENKQYQNAPRDFSEESKTSKVAYPGFLIFINETDLLDIKQAYKAYIRGWRQFCIRSSDDAGKCQPRKREIGGVSLVSLVLWHPGVTHFNADTDPYEYTHLSQAKVASKGYLKVEFASEGNGNALPAPARILPRMSARPPLYPTSLPPYHGHWPGSNVHNPEAAAGLFSNPYIHGHYHPVPYPAYAAPQNFYFERERAQLLAEKNKLEGELRSVAKTVELYRKRYGPLDSALNHCSPNTSRNAVASSDMTHSSPTPTPATIITTRKNVSNEPMSLRSIINGPASLNTYSSRARDFGTNANADDDDDVPSLQVNPARMMNSRALGLSPHFLNSNYNNNQKRKMNELAQFARLKKQQRTR